MQKIIVWVQKMNEMWANCLITRKSIAINDLKDGQHYYEILNNVIDEENNAQLASSWITTKSNMNSGKLK